MTAGGTTDISRRSPGAVPDPIGAEQPPTRLERLLEHDRAAFAVLLILIPIACWSWIVVMARGIDRRVRMGVDHEIYCVGCCWALMLLLFVGGVMNLP
jgi:predicted metal-binding membrane protein